VFRFVERIFGELFIHSLRFFLFWGLEEEGFLFLFHFGGVF
jgi:hypothetical protein